MDIPFPGCVSSTNSNNNDENICKLSSNPNVIGSGGGINDTKNMMIFLKPSKLDTSSKNQKKEQTPIFNQQQQQGSLQHDHQQYHQQQQHEEELHQNIDLSSDWSEYFKVMMNDSNGIKPFVYPDGIVCPYCKNTIKIPEIYDNSLSTEIKKIPLKLLCEEAGLSKWQIDKIIEARASGDYIVENFYLEIFFRTIFLKRGMCFDQATDSPLNSNSMKIDPARNIVFYPHAEGLTPNKTAEEQEFEARCKCFVPPENLENIIQQQLQSPDPMELIQSPPPIPHLQPTVVNVSATAQPPIRLLPPPPPEAWHPINKNNYELNSTAFCDKTGDSLKLNEPATFISNREVEMECRSKDPYLQAVNTALFGFKSEKLPQEGTKEYFKAAEQYALYGISLLNDSAAGNSNNAIPSAYDDKIAGSNLHGNDRELTEGLTNNVMGVNGLGYNIPLGKTLSEKQNFSDLFQTDGNDITPMKVIGQHASINPNCDYSANLNSLANSANLVTQPLFYNLNSISGSPLNQLQQSLLASNIATQQQFQQQQQQQQQQSQQQQPKSPRPIQLSKYAKTSGINPAAQQFLLQAAAMPKNRAPTNFTFPPRFPPAFAIPQQVIYPNPLLTHPYLSACFKETHVNTSIIQQQQYNIITAAPQEMLYYAQLLQQTQAVMSRNNRANTAVRNLSDISRSTSPLFFKGPISSPASYVNNTSNAGGSTSANIKPLSQPNISNISTGLPSNPLLNNTISNNINNSVSVSNSGTGSQPQIQTSTASPTTNILNNMNNLSSNPSFYNQNQTILNTNSNNIGSFANCGNHSNSSNNNNSLQMNCSPKIEEPVKILQPGKSLNIGSLPQNTNSTISSASTSCGSTNTISTPLSTSNNVRASSSKKAGILPEVTNSNNTEI